MPGMRHGAIGRGSIILGEQRTRRWGELQTSGYC